MARADRNRTRTAPNIYLADFAVTFEKNPITGQLARYINETQANKQLEALVGTRQGEIPNEPLVGCNVENINFDMNDQLTYDLIQQSITEAVNNNLPFINLISVVINSDVTPPVGDPNAVIVTITYSLADPSQIYTVSVPLRLIR